MLIVSFGCFASLSGPEGGKLRLLGFSRSYSLSNVFAAQDFDSIAFPHDVLN
jgi:hypothetical protein